MSMWWENVWAIRRQIDKLLTISTVSLSHFDIKQNKKGVYYALKRDMPYFADEPDIKGIFIIGTPSDVEGKMIPDINYHRFCTEESYQKKMEAIRIREEEEAAAREEKEKTSENHLFL